MPAADSLVGKKCVIIRGIFKGKSGVVAANNCGSVTVRTHAENCRQHLLAVSFSDLIIKEE